MRRSGGEGPRRHRRLTEDEIIAMLDELGDMITALRDAEPEHRLEVYRNLGLRLTYTRTHERCGQK